MRDRLIRIKAGRTHGRYGWVLPLITMPTLTPSVFSPESTVGEIVAAHPSLSRLFENLGIDFCCGGKIPLADACAKRNLDLSTTLALLESAASTLATTPNEVDAAAMSLSQLADHIEQTHHAYTRTELARILEMATKVSTKHGWRDSRLIEMGTVVNYLANEMFDHMEKEESVLFPLVRRLEAGTAHDADLQMLSGPIQQMEAEHQNAGEAIARLRELTDGFTPGEDSCNTHRALLSGLAEFEADLHRHVHKENNILFPRALERASA